MIKVDKYKGGLLILVAAILLILILSLNILYSDFRYAHTSHSVKPIRFDWFGYSVETKLNNFIKNWNYDKSPGLPVVNLFISEQQENKLLNDIPASTKRWVKGFYLNKDRFMQKIKLRFKGDNPSNWLFEKKSWRIKTKKSEMFGRVRVFNYLSPQNSNFLSEFSGASIANRMGILSSNVRLIELFINNESKGIYIETERLDEGFLRRNKVMPVNLYRAEQANTETFVADDTDIFNNPGQWTKSAVFNKVEKDNKNDLEHFLSLIHDSEADVKKFDELIEMIDIDAWATFAAYQILTQNYHNDDSHNMRLLIDPWTGFVRPLVHDPFIGIDSNQKILLDRSSHQLLKILNKSSFFIEAKYKKLYEYVTTNKVLYKEASNLENIDNKIQKSLSRDFDSIQTKYFSSLNDGPDDKYIDIDDSILARKEFYEKLKEHERGVERKLISTPEVSWSMGNKRLNIVIDGDIPVSGIEFYYGANAPKWLAIDVNNNRVLDENDKKFFLDRGSIFADIKLFSNRVSVSNNLVKIDRKSKVKTSATKFIFFSERSVRPLKIVSRQLFSGKKIPLSNIIKIASGPNKHNKVITSKLNKTTYFSGVVKIKDDIIINNKVEISPGTIFELSEGASIVFRNTVQANGTVINPITFKKNNADHGNWGTIALQGVKTSGSMFNNVKIIGGSGDSIGSILYTSMLSVHDTKNINLANLLMEDNSTYDDALHIIYSSNITLSNIKIINSYMDAIDIDMSDKVILSKVDIYNSGNDGIDFMESNASVNNSDIKGSVDKAVSVGESSQISIDSVRLINNNIGVAIKDGSSANIINSNFKNNKIHIDAYSKNWRYNDGGYAYVKESAFEAGANKFRADIKSTINIDKYSTIKGNVIKDGNKILFN